MYEILMETLLCTRQFYWDGKRYTNVETSPYSQELIFKVYIVFMKSFHHSSVGKESACNIGDPRSIPGSGRSAGEGIGYPLQYSGLENSMDCIVRGVPKSQTQLSDFHFTYSNLT